jgi:hypothetical protein
MAPQSEAAFLSGSDHAAAKTPDATTIAKEAKKTKHGMLLLISHSRQDSSSMKTLF